MTTRKFSDITTDINESLYKCNKALMELAHYYESEVDRKREGIHHLAKNGDTVGDVDFDLDDLIYYVNKAKQVEQALGYIRKAMALY